MKILIYKKIYKNKFKKIIFNGSTKCRNRISEGATYRNKCNIIIDL